MEQGVWKFFDPIQMEKDYEAELAKEAAEKEAQEKVSKEEYERTHRLELAAEALNAIHSHNENLAQNNVLLLKSVLLLLVEEIREIKDNYLTEEVANRRFEFHQYNDY